MSASRLAAIRGTTPTRMASPAARCAAPCEVHPRDVSRQHRRHHRGGHLRVHEVREPEREKGEREENPGLPHPPLADEDRRTRDHGLVHPPRLNHSTSTSGALAMRGTCSTSIEPMPAIASTSAERERARPEQTRAAGEQERARDVGEHGAPDDPPRDRLPHVREVPGAEAQDGEAGESDGEERPAGDLHYRPAAATAAFRIASNSSPGFHAEAMRRRSRCACRRRRGAARPRPRRRNPSRVEYSSEGWW